MNTLVIVRQVPDPAAPLHLEGLQMQEERLNFVMDGLDEYALETALRLRETGQLHGEIITIGMGNARQEETLRLALALGADRAIHIRHNTYADAMDLSRVIARIAHEENVSLILTGGSQSDSDSQALGAATAARLGWSQVTWVTTLNLNEQTLTGRHSTEQGNEAFALELPAVITTQPVLDEPRYPTLPNIIKARKKEFRTEELDSNRYVTLLHAEPVIKERQKQNLTGQPAEIATQLATILREKIL